MFLKHIREQLRKSAEHEAKMRRQTREKHHDDFVKNPTSEWARFTEDFNQRKCRFNSYSQHSIYCLAGHLNPLIIDLVGLILAELSSLISSYFSWSLCCELHSDRREQISDYFEAVEFRREEERVIITSTSPGDEYTSPKDRLRKMMETPPMNIDEKSDSVFPYGFPNSDRKE